MARFALRDPARITIGRARTVAEAVTHALYPVSPELKFPLLLALLAKTEFKSVIVFTRTRHGADHLLGQLKEANHSATVLHGDRSQGQRKASLAGFKDGYYEVLVATDLAARGLDLEDVSHVINYDIPLSPDDYVHRVGRTGRSEAVGDAFTLFTPRESNAVKAIERFIRATIPQLKLAGFDYQAIPPATAPGESGPRGHPQPRIDDDDEGWIERRVGDTAHAKRKPDEPATPRAAERTGDVGRTTRKPDDRGPGRTAARPSAKAHPKRRPGEQAREGTKAHAGAKVQTKGESGAGHPKGKYGGHTKRRIKGRPGATNHMRRKYAGLAEVRKRR